MDRAPSTALSEADRRRTMRISRFDAVAFALMVGLGEAYFVADGVRLGAGATGIALLVGLPLAIGAFGPVLALRLLEAFGRRKPIVVGAAAVQAAALLLLAALAALGWTTTGLLIGVAIVYQIGSQAAGTAWSSWFGDLVPAAERGRYFATRNRGAYAGTFLGLVAGGLLLYAVEPSRAGIAAAGGGAGFALAYLLAGVCRCVSVGFLLASREGSFSGMPDRGRVLRFLRTERGSDVGRFLLFVGLLQVGVYLASPFFNPHMLEELEFTYLEYMAASASLVLAKVAVLSWWGRSIDRWGARRTLVRGAVLLSVVPLPWVLAGDIWAVLACETLSGIAWSGFEVGQFSYLLELGYRRMRPTIFAAQTIVTGQAQLVGGLLGSALLASGLATRDVFVSSGVLRLVVVVALLLRLPVRTATLRARPVLRIAGFRAGTGMAQRPVDPPTEDVERSA